MIEARHGSLYQRLKERGLLDRVMRMLLDGEKDAKEMVRWLRLEGVGSSPSAIYRLVQMHGMAWRYEDSQEAARALALPEDMEAASAEFLRRKIQIATFEADGLKELRMLAQIAGDSTKLAQAERKVRVTEAEASRKVQATRIKGAEFIHEVLSEAARLERLRDVHKRQAEAGATTAQHLQAIISEVWGEAAE